VAAAALAAEHVLALHAEGEIQPEETPAILAELSTEAGAPSDQDHQQEETPATLAELSMEAGAPSDQDHQQGETPAIALAAIHAELIVSRAASVGRGRLAL
jgi:hypothetical protein